MRKNNKFSAVLFALCICALLPEQVEAKEEKESFTFDINQFLKKVDKVEDSIINNKIPMYKQDALWLITDTPSVDPSEERNYYFIDKNNAKLKLTTFYDKKGNKVEEEDASAVRKYEQKMYLPVTLDGKNFVIRDDYNLINDTVTTNFVDFDEEYFFDEDTLAEYGRFTDVSAIIPEDMQKEKYSAYDLDAILEVINDPDYEIFVVPMKKELKKGNE